jgi:DNA replicative helicase MCM subunit Mcm2 (Cdc46/Mcm family)
LPCLSSLPVYSGTFKWVDLKMICQLLSKSLCRYGIVWSIVKTSIFDSVFGYEGVKRTFIRSLNSKEPVHILLVGQPGHAKTLFLKCILERFGEKMTFFTVGSNASKSGLIDVLFDMQYLLIDEIENLKPEYQNTRIRYYR